MQNHVGRALQNLAGTVEGVGRQIGENRVRNAEIGLKRAVQALQMPGLKFEAQKAQDQLEKLNQPVTVGTFMQPGKPSENWAGFCRLRSKLTH